MEGDCMPMQAGVVLRCAAGCQQLYCFDCDLYIHDSLHVCPGCEAAPPRRQDGAAAAAHDMDVG